MNDLWVIKISLAGEMEWQKCLGGSKGDSGRYFFPDGSDGYIIGGGTASTDGDVVGLEDSSAVWIVRIDNEGKIDWQFFVDHGGLTKIIPTSDGGFVACGVWVETPDAWGQNYDGVIYKISNTPLSQQEVNQDNDAWSISPNPAGNQLQILTRYPELSPRLAVIVNTLGERVITEKMTGFETVLDVSQLSPGVYWVLLHSEKGGVTQKIVVKQ
jgi:hypothetical protein